MKHRFTVLAIAVAATSLFAAQGASGAVTMGSELAKPVDNIGVFCATTCSWIQSTLPDRVVSAPTDGVIVRWRIKTDGASGPYSLQVARPAGGNTRTGVSTSDPVSTAAAGISEFPTRLSVKQGDNIGLNWTSSNTAIFMSDGGTPGASALYFAPALINGATIAEDVVNGNTEFLVNADVEPDADADGFGDETQDTCLGIAGPANGCAALAPAVKLTVAKRQSIRKLSGTVSLDRIGSVLARAVVTYKVKGKRVTIKTKLVKSPLVALTDTKLKFAFSKAQRAKLSKQLKSGRKLSAKISFVARDTGGSSSNASATVRLKR